MRQTTNAFSATYKQEADWYPWPVGTLQGRKESTSQTVIEPRCATFSQSLHLLGYTNRSYFKNEVNIQFTYKSLQICERNDTVAYTKIKKNKQNYNFAFGSTWTETWFLTLREERKLRVRTGCWGEYFDRRGMRWQEAGENCIMRSFITCTLLQV
jgi:hypothetical protein